MKYSCTCTKFRSSFICWHALAFGLIHHETSVPSVYNITSLGPLHAPGCQSTTDRYGHRRTDSAHAVDGVADTSTAAAAAAAAAEEKVDEHEATAVECGQLVVYSWQIDGDSTGTKYNALGLVTVAQGDTIDLNCYTNLKQGALQPVEDFDIHGRFVEYDKGCDGTISQITRPQKRTRREDLHNRAIDRNINKAAVLCQCKLNEDGTIRAADRIAITSAIAQDKAASACRRAYARKTQ